MSPTEAGAGAGAHLLVYPFPSYGHIIPLLDLTSKLLDRGVTVTVAISPSSLPLLHPLHSRLHHLLLPQLEFPPPSFPGNRLFGMIRLHRDHHGPLIREWFRSHPSPPAAILSDDFLGWTNDLATELGLKRASFSTSGALAFSVTVQTWLDRPRNEGPDDTDSRISFPKVPNSPSYPWWQISVHYRTAREGEPDFEFYRQNQLSNLASWGIVFNSSWELEREYIDHVKRDYRYEGGRVWAVGPALPDADDSRGPTTRGGTSSVDSREAMAWLYSKAEGSVTYICFGSRHALTSHQVEGLAAGLERSGTHFMWCMTRPQWRSGEEAGELPEGFEWRVKGWGLVIRVWAPQVAILRHRAVGSFVTHCGWNSSLEGVAAGVAMLTWPMASDQFANSDLLVDGLRVGVRLGAADRWVPGEEEVAGAVAAAEDEGLRGRARELGEAVRRAVEKGGSSYLDFG